jgi:hypothetical protein
MDLPPQQSKKNTQAHVDNRNVRTFGEFIVVKLVFSWNDGGCEEIYLEFKMLRSYCFFILQLLSLWSLGPYRMVVGLTTTYAISDYHH